MSKSFLVHLRHCQQKADAEFAARVANITLRQFMLLDAAARIGASSQNRLIEETGIDRSTLSDVARRLEDAGYIRIDQSQDDARANLVSLTAEGRKVLRKARPHADYVSRQAMNRMVMWPLVDAPAVAA